MSANQNERLTYLTGQTAVGLATQEEWAEWASLSVEAIDRARSTSAEVARAVAKLYFAYLSAKFGDEAARDAWKAAPPKRSRGYRISVSKRRNDAVLVAMDAMVREMGLSPEAAAEFLGVGEDPRDSRRSLDRIKARQNRRTPKDT